MSPDWSLDLSEIPKNEPYLVFLAEEAVGTQVHVAIDMRVANGHIRIVGGHFAYDMPDILMWHPMVPLPVRGAKSAGPEAN